MKGFLVFLKLSFWHFLITIAVILLVTVIPVANQLKPAVYILYFIVVLLCYFLSGYFLTKIKVKWIWYFAIAMVGIAFWTVCFIQSPNSTNYKNDANAGGWFLYEFYISARSPLNFFEGEAYSVKRDLFGKFIFPVILSTCQFLGGLYKLKKGNRRRIAGSNIQHKRNAGFS